MLKIRLARHGRKGRAFFRVVVQDSRKPRDGRFVEMVGHYDPLADPATFEIDTERVKHWLSHGAQPTETVHRFLAKEGLIEPWQPKPRSKRADAKRAAAEAEAAAAAEAPEAETEEPAEAEAPADEPAEEEAPSEEAAEEPEAEAAEASEDE